MSPLSPKYSQLFLTFENFVFNLGMNDELLAKGAAFGDIA